MPKKIEQDEEYEEEIEDEEDEEEEPEQREQRVRGRPRSTPPLRRLKQSKPVEQQKRYTAFMGNDVGVADAETNEALTGVSGVVNLEQRQLLISLVFVLLQGQAEIIERLERVENAIGIMQEG